MIALWQYAGSALLGGVMLAAVIYGTVRARLNSRPCPRCGRRVRVGELECEACGFDFRAATGG